ncbi:MAG: hypothetical protein K8T26_12810 [Lentisphaerae bacterium]|nr:hypothetical protein [Lentisphaerota bacterium]
MRTIRFAALVLACSLATAGAQSQPQAPVQRIGAGLMLGEPTGITVKKWMSDTVALDAGLAWSYEYNSSLQLHGDYLIHRYDWLMPRNLAGTLPVYFGLGGRIKFEAEGDPDEPNDDATVVGARFPVGVNFLPYTGPYDAFFEVAPIVDITPQAELSFNAAIGMRLYFR